MKILDECGLEVAIPSISKPGDTSYVVISKETVRFVNEIHKHNAEVRSSSELLENLPESQRSEPYEERKVTTRSKETWAAPSTKETRAESHPCSTQGIPVHKKIIPTNEEKWITIHAHSGNGSDLAASISRTVTTISRHFDHAERESDGSRRWDGQADGASKAGPKQAAADPRGSRTCVCANTFWNRVWHTGREGRINVLPWYRLVGVVEYLQ